jgi:hypothetical protein
MVMTKKILNQRKQTLRIKAEANYQHLTEKGAITGLDKNKKDILKTHN